MQKGLVRACHDLSEGGLAVAAAEMCIGGRLGMDLTVPTKEILWFMFGETNGCLLVEVPQRTRQHSKLNSTGWIVITWARCVRTVTWLPIAGRSSLLDLPVGELVNAWMRPNRRYG